MKGGRHQHVVVLQKNARLQLPQQGQIVGVQRKQWKIALKHSDGNCGWWFRNPVNSPVEVGSLSHYHYFYKVLLTSQLVIDTFFLNFPPYAVFVHLICHDEHMTNLSLAYQSFHFGWQPSYLFDCHQLSSFQIKPDLKRNPTPYRIHVLV